MQQDTYDIDRFLSVWPYVAPGVLVAINTRGHIVPNRDR